jgi:beta-lactamase superfamily II metal-dependent hydrolase
VRTGDGKHILFTGDAGVPALTLAAERAEALGFHLPSQLELVQIPHHGSKHNVGPTILDRILGPKDQQQTALVRAAVVSAAPEGEPKHPSKRVTNAFHRRGAFVHATQGATKLHQHDAPPRNGWNDVPALPFYDRVEE